MSYGESKKKVVVNSGFPDHLASDEIKNTEEFGLAMSHAIQAEWFLGDNDSASAFYDKRDEYHLRRL